jgi:hypothetical protein
VRRGANSDIAAGPRLILDDDRTADGGAEMGADDARHDVGRSGGRERHDDLDRTFGIACRPRLLQAKSGCRHRAYREARVAQYAAARWIDGFATGHGALPVGLFWYLISEIAFSEMAFFQR